MPAKRDPDRTPGEKLIRLFTLLLFSGRRYSLTDLAERLGCSKQTVLRYVAALDGAYEVKVRSEREGNRVYFSLPRPAGYAGILSYTPREIALLHMCKAFTETLLGREQFRQAAGAVERTGRLLGEGEEIPASVFGAYRPGSIDYTPHQETLQTLLEAWRGKRVCEVRYRGLQAPRSKLFRIKPLKIFSHNGTIYVHAQRAPDPGRKVRKWAYDPLLVLHRIREARITRGVFEVPPSYDFEAVFNRHFGVIKDRAFPVTLELRGWAARFAAERMWSPDQKVREKAGGVVVLTFTASSEEETVSLVLSFGALARVLAPERLAGRVREEAAAIAARYGGR